MIDATRPGSPDCGHIVPSDMQFIRLKRGHIHSEIGECSTPLAGVHSQPFVVIGIDEALGGKTVDLNRTIEDSEVLRKCR